MAEDFSDRERYTVLALCILALLLFFSPLLTIQAPMVGEQQVTGYDVFSRVNNMRQNLQSKEQAEIETPALPRQPNGSPVEPTKVPEIPLSVQLGWMIPGAIIIAWVGALVTIIGAFSDSKVAKISSAVGTCAAIWAVVHVSIMNSDMHSWFAASMQTSQADLKDNPFAAMAGNLGSLIASAFQMKAGWGLFALVFFLGVSAVLTFSRMLYSPSGDPSYQETETAP